MSHNHDTSKLDDLIVTLIDSIRGYDHSADKQAAAPFAGFFRETAGERRQLVDLLGAESRRLGGTPADYGSAAATIHRRVEDLRVALGGGTKAIVSEIERGEDYLVEEFERAVRDERMSPDTRALVQRCFEAVRRGHDRVRQLKHELQTA